MQIILLSGGSGQRLWPLSNNIRSKQFLKLFKDETGNYESMVQRVYRQIKAVDPVAEITVATGKSQVSAIKNQLGDSVSICVEPCRRDTFPAIALAASYLHGVKEVNPDEPVVVCPVDPYVENSYYKTIISLGTLLLNGKSRLALMGVEPTYPSEKYGYIIPKTTADISEVAEFKEKPSKEVAEEYLKSGALWNAGVFAFRLGYLLQIAENIIGTSNYQDILADYEKLHKISFDYAVVEKEASISVKRYPGAWKDVGTWNTMTEVMAESSMGNVITDPTCSNTHIVNELDIPVLCMGLKDVIVAASSDGILIADKDQSSYMKPLVESLEQQAMYAEKSWGIYKVIDVQPGSMTIKVQLHAGHCMKYHSHERRDEVWTVVSGTGRACIDDVEQKVKPGDVITIRAGCKHTVVADENSDLSILEVQVGEDVRVGDKKVWLNPIGKS